MRLIYVSVNKSQKVTGEFTMAKAEIIYPKNVGASVIMNFT